MEKQVNVFIISCTVALCMVTSATSRSVKLPAYELHVKRTGSSEVTLRCSSKTTFKFEYVNDTIFWRNRTTARDAGLRERNDVMVTETANQRGIRFNLTRDFEGYYSCGKRIDCTSIDESPRVTLISHQKVVPLPEPFQRTVTAMPGTTATLQCPIQPGPLRQFYSVRWRKDSKVVAELIESSNPADTASRHSIDKRDYSLVIENVEVDDASSAYKCEVVVRDPLSHMGETKIRLRSYPDVPLTLQVPAPAPATSGRSSNHSFTLNFHVYATVTISPGPSDAMVTSPSDTSSFNCTAMGLPRPYITWSFIDAASGTEKQLTDAASPEYSVTTTSTTTGDEGLFRIGSALTLLEGIVNGTVLCKAGLPGIEYTASSEAQITVIV